MPDKFLYSIALIATLLLLPASARAAEVLHQCPAVAAAGPGVSAPPASLSLDPIFKKYIDAGGIPIVATGKVCDRALQVAYEIVSKELSGPLGPKIRRNLILRAARIDIFSDVAGEHFTDLPEAKWLENDPAEKSRCAGGPTEKSMTTKVCEGNLLAGWWLGLGPGYKQFHTRFGRESVLFHEFGHMIQDFGLDAPLQEKVTAAYGHAKQRGLFPNRDGSVSYMMSNEHEFFACATSDWFNASGPNNPSGIWSREQLKSFPELYDILSAIYPADVWTWPKQ